MAYRNKKTTAIKSHVSFLVQSSNDAIIEADLKKRIAYWNPAAEKLYGYKKEEVLGKSVEIILPAGKSGEIDGLRSKAEKGKDITHYQTKRLRKDGATVNVALTMSAIRDNKGKIIGYSTISHDFTKHIELEKKLRLYAAALEEAPEGIQLTDLKGNIIYSNKAIENMYGFSRSELLGKNVSIMNADPEIAGKSIIPGIIKNGFWKGDIMVRRKDGTIFPIALSTSLVKNSKGIPIAMVGTIRDITERKKVEEMKSEFLSLAAHELKTPLTTLKLISQAHIRKYKKFGKDQIKLSELELLEHEIERLNLLINDILDDARIETGKLNMRFEVFDLNDLLKEVVNKMRVIEKRHSIIYRKSRNIKVIGDRSRIEQVIINLISNAAKYSPIFSIIEIKLISLKKIAKVCVTDEGEGIPKDKQDLIFDRFYQVKEHPEKGFGLGLYICREIVKRHKGQLTVKSEIGKGSEFCLTLKKS